MRWLSLSFAVCFRSTMAHQFYSLVNCGSIIIITIFFSLSLAACFLSPAIPPMYHVLIIILSLFCIALHFICTLHTAHQNKKRSHSIHDIMNFEARENEWTASNYVRFVCHLRIAFYKSLDSHLVWQAESHTHKNTKFAREIIAFFPSIQRQQAYRYCRHRRCCCCCCVAYVTMMNVWYPYVCYFYVHISFLFCSFMVYLIQAHGIQKQMMISEAYKLKTIIFAYHLNWGNAANDACLPGLLYLKQVQEEQKTTERHLAFRFLFEKIEAKSICVLSLFLRNIVIFNQPISASLSKNITFDIRYRRISKCNRCVCACAYAYARACVYAFFGLLCFENQNNNNVRISTKRIRVKKTEPYIHASYVVRTCIHISKIEATHHTVTVSHSHCYYHC